MNQSEATVQIKNTVEAHFFALAKWLTGELSIPKAFVRLPSYPGIDVIVNGQRMLAFKNFFEPLQSEAGNFAGVFTTAEAAAFVPYGSKGPSLSVDTAFLGTEAQSAGVGESALLEILVLHEIVHACMMGGIAQRHANHAWITNPDYRYIHEAVALKTCEFGIDKMLRIATPSDVKKYLYHVQASAVDREAGAHYAPYFSKYREKPLADFWAQLQESQAQNGIFKEVEELV